MTNTNWRNPLRQHIILFQFFFRNNSQSTVNVKECFLKHVQFASGNSFSLNHMNNLNPCITNHINYNFGGSFYNTEFSNYDSDVKPGDQVGFMILIPRNSDIYDDVIVTFHQNNGEVIAMKRITPQYPNVPTYGK